jgi:hypothetical protein
MEYHQAHHHINPKCPCKQLHHPPYLLYQWYQWQLRQALYLHWQWQ